MLLQKRNKTQVEVSDNVYEVIVNTLKESFEIKQQWLTYSEIFPNIKSEIQTEIGAAVWHVSTVLEHLAESTTNVLIREEENEIQYFISIELENMK